MKWLESIVSTTLVVLTGCVLAVLVTLFYMVATMFGKDLDPILFGSMLAFTGSCMGIGYKQFKSKRETEWAVDNDTGVAYKPGTRITREIHPSERYNAGIKNTADFSDVNVIEVPQQIRRTEPESVEERENGGVKVLSPPPEPEEKWEGDE